LVFIVAGFNRFNSEFKEGYDKYGKLKVNFFDEGCLTHENCHLICRKTGEEVHKTAYSGITEVAE